VTPLEPIRHQLMIEADQERTFHTFLRQVVARWHGGTHPITPENVSDVRVEEWLGGRLYEKHGQGGKRDLGQITSWDPPESFSFTWNLIPGPELTEVDLHFQKLGPTLTRVVVTHHGWERLSNALFDRYARYAGGWAWALRRFEAMFEGGPSRVLSASDAEAP
jgi:Activator of Hsp90 ATPase homolog 1-like protein